MAARILVVDDTEGNRYAVSRLLRGAGMEVLEADTGTEALRQLAARPDLVVLDINLPDISGYDLCRRIKDDPATATIPVMHVSASYTGSADRAYGLEAGADAYLTHPLDPPVFIATTRALLRASHAEAEFHKAAGEWRTTFDAIRDAIFLIERSGSVHRCNRAAADLVHCAPQEIIGWSWERTVSALDTTARPLLVDLPAHPDGQWELRIGESDYRVSTHRPSGESTATATDALVVLVFSDVTAERGAQREREALLEHTEQARHDAEVARRDAENANRAKADFLAVMSHELRTPLNAIGGFTDLIALGVRGPVTEEQKRDLDKIRRSQVTLMSLINDLLSFAKLESGSVHFDSLDVPVGDALSSAAEFVESQVRTKGVHFHCDGCEADLTVRADPDKLQQILLNLLSNAVKFTDEGGTITLGHRVDGDHLVIFVHDTGRGIPADKLEFIFDPFMQIDQRLARSNQGVGLGLAISRDLARGMNGELLVESVVGQGSTFSLRLSSRQ